MVEKKIRYIFNGKYADGKGRIRYVRCWAEGRGRNREFVVQVWNRPEPTGEPEGDWAMPAVFGAVGSMAQAVLQTDYK